jgi:hypothetical protein
MKKQAHQINGTPYQRGLTYSTTHPRFLASCRRSQVRSKVAKNSNRLFDVVAEKSMSAVAVASIELIEKLLLIKALIVS